jgi:hypothetical protein
MLNSHPMRIENWEFEHWSDPVFVFFLLYG